MFKNIDEALNWIMAQHKGELSFTDFKKVVEEIGNPQDDFKMIHVAGTDGKGSTVTFLRDLLMSQGYKVGTLQSPHFLTHLDRIRLNGENIKEEAFLRILNEHYDFFVDKHLGMFEMDYLIMCQYFKEEKIDYAIIEVGLGGRLDSTNVCNYPLLSIITTIGYDHMDRLGNTLEEICGEKCGIIKNNSHVLIGHLNDNLKEIVKDYCRRLNSSYFELGEYQDLGNRHFLYNGEEYQILSYAKYQLHNASLALCAFEQLAKICDMKIDKQKANDALSKTLWAGRFQIVRENPRVILDGAHNIHGVAALVESYKCLSGSKCIVFSALKRKEHKKMLEMLKKNCDCLILTTFEYHEALKQQDIIELADITDNDWAHAISEAIKSYDNVLVCGSLYFISEVAASYDFVKGERK